MYLNNFLKTINLEKIFIDKDKYFAHRDAKENSYKETIYEHSLNTLIVSDYLLRKNNFKIIKEMTHLFYKNSKNLINIFKIECSFVENDIFNFFINSFYLSILLHDNGKHNPFFQEEKMDNKIINDQFIIDNNILNNDTSHSKYSNAINYFHTYQLINESKINKLNNFKNFIINPFFEMLLFNIKKHHAGLDNITNIELKNIKNINNLFDNELNIIFDIFYSILVQSDMLSTTYYMTEQKNKLDYTNLELTINIFENYLDKKLAKINKEEIKTLEIKKSYNKYLYENIKYFDEKEILNTNNLNDLKYKVASNIVNSNNVDEIRIFNGNTGIGKTNISMIYINELLKKFDINKVIYSLPLNILINQTYDELNDTFEFNENKINIVNSENTIQKNGENNINYWNLKYDFDNFNNEIVLTSTINFFHKLFHKDKKSKLSLINLENSLLILDEIQLIDDRYFELVYKYLLMLNKYLNVKILILSATLPIPKKFENEFLDKFILDKNLNQTILNHKLFERYEYDLNMFEKNGKDISNYINNSKDEFNFLIVHNSIKKCNELYNSMNLNDDIKVYFYNNTIIKPILSKILNEVRNNKTKKILIISTMKIETGVDISFDCGFKFSATIDSSAQFAGRINRYGKRKQSKVFILSDNIKIFGQTQERDVIAKNNGSNKAFFDQYLTNIDSYYKKLFDVSKSNKIVYFDKLDFEELNKIKLIDNDYIQTSFFVHLENVKDVLIESDLKLYESIFGNNYDNNILKEKYKKEFFFINKDIKYLFSLFNFRGYVNSKTEFYKTLKESNCLIIEHKQSKEIIEIHYLINKESFFYDLEKGLDTNKKELDIEDIEDLINSL